MIFDLSGKTALVTGAGGAIGRSLVLALAQAGANVTALSRSEERLAETCAIAAQNGSRVRVVHGDVTKRSQVDDAIRGIVQDHERLDVLVTCAGMQLRKAALDIEEDEWDLLLAVNLKGVFLCCQAAARMMRLHGGGSIVNITSLTAEIGLPHLSAYGASKGGVNQLTKALAVEWAPYRIRVNAVGPGRVRTPMTAALFQDEAVRESFLRLIPLGRAGTPDDVAGAVVFFASDASAYVTGQALYVDGGWLASGGNPLR